MTPQVLAAMAQPVIGHLDPAFLDLMDVIKEQLRQTFRTSAEFTLPLSTPASAAMEACLVNVLEPGDQAIVCINGVFGGRMAEIVRRSGAECIAVEDAWGEPIDLDKAETALKENKNAKVLAFVHAETSTGVLSDAESLAALARKYDCLSLADCVTSLGGVPLEVEKWGLDLVYSGTQKCLSASPGLAPLSLSPRALAAVQSRKTPVQSWFLDFNLLLGYWRAGGKRAYHHTAPIHNLYGLHAALESLLEEGVDESCARHRRLHEQLRAGLEGMGIEYLVDPPYRLPQLNAVRIPNAVDDAAVRAALLRDHQLEIGGGLGEYAGKIWRIGLMGASCTKRHVELCLESLKQHLA